MWVLKDILSFLVRKLCKQVVHKRLVEKTGSVTRLQHVTCSSETGLSATNVVYYPRRVVTTPFRTKDQYNKENPSPTRSKPLSSLQRGQYSISLPQFKIPKLEIRPRKTLNISEDTRF